MRFEPTGLHHSHGTGEFKAEDFARLGRNVIFEPREVPAYEVWAGVPARRLRSRR